MPNLKKNLIIVLILSLGLSAPLQAGKDKLRTVREAPNRKNLNWDLQTGKQVYDDQLAALKQKGIPVDNDAAMVSRLTRIMNRLKPHTLIPDIPYRVHFVDHKTVNAVCYLGGGILFFRGLFDPKEGLVNATSDDEIAAVMGHEMAHATLRHSYKAYRKATALSIFGTIASTVIGAAGGTDWSKLFDSVFDFGTGLYFPSYSRKNESAADLEGMYTMIAGNYQPEKAISLWERAADKKGGRGKTSIFASHPASRKRANDLRQHLENIRGQ